MKKIVFAFALLLSCQQLATAQLTVGGVVGANYSNIVAKSGFLSESDYTVNYFLGATVSIPLTERLNFIGDAVYALKGTKTSFGLSTVESQVRINYLDLIPKIEFRPINNIGIAVGVSLGVNAGEATKSGTGAWQRTNGPIKIYNSNFAVIGALRGYFGNFFVEAAYAQGLNNITDVTFTDPNGNPLAISRSYLRNMNLGIGYLLEL